MAAPRWLELTDADGTGLKVSTKGNPFSFSALHFTAPDLAAVQQSYELKPRPESYSFPRRKAVRAGRAGA